MTYETILLLSIQDARYWMLGAGALGRPRGMVRGGRREEGLGWGTRVYLWWIHVDIWQNQYNIVKFKKKKTKNKIKKRCQTKRYSHLPSLTKDYFNDLKSEKNYCNIDQEEGHQITTHVDTFLEGKN